jgi:hypothetical protein
VTPGTRARWALTYSRVVMIRKLISASIAAAVVMVAAPAVAAASSPVQVTAFSLPSCASPGQTISATVSVQNTTYYPQAFYAQEWVGNFGPGFALQSSSVQGPYGLPPYTPLTDSVSEQIPSYTPYGYYTVNVGVGPSSSSPTSWSSMSQGLTISPWCF